MITVKGQADIDRFIISRIIDPSAPNIEFKNITFDCKTIKDADGNVFFRQETGEWQDEHGKPMCRGSFAGYCSNCGKWSEYLTDYCGNCRADMRGVER